MGKGRTISNAEHEAQIGLIKQIDVEQNFANQAYADFKSHKFGIESCCYTDFQNALLQKELCDWLNASSKKVVVSTEVAGVFVEPLAKINTGSSMSCPSTPTNVCTVLDLASIIGATGTFTECFTSNSKLWTITHNLGKYPSVTIVDDKNEVVVGAIDYVSTNQVTVSFNSPFDGCAFLN